MAVSGWYGPGWWQVGTSSMSDLALIASQHAVTLALLQDRIEDLELDDEIDGGGPDSTYEDDFDGGSP